MLQGRFEELPLLTEEEREILLGAAWVLNELVPAPEPLRSYSDGSGRPGDEFNERGDVRVVLVRHGWVCARGGENEYWRRPGKSVTWSATLKNGVFFVFSSNAAPFEPQRAYSRFAVYALLEHAGDFGKAAAALRAEGYGGSGVEPSDVDISALTKAGAPPIAPATVAPTGPVAIVRRLCDVSRETLVWLWPGRIPLGKLTLLAGDPGLGKSLVTLDIAARVSRGLAWPDSPLLPQPVGSVILFNAEDDVADTIAPRLDRAGADDARVFAVEGVQRHDPKQNSPVRWYFSLENDLPRLEEVILAHPDVRLIVIDPISAYCGKTDSHNNAEVRALLAPPAELAARYRVAVVAVTHLSKSGGTKAVYRAMGSLAFTAAARAVWSIVKDPSDGGRRLFLPAKLNLAADPDGLAYRVADGRVAWEAEPVRMHADEAFAAEAAGPDAGPRNTAREEAAEWLQQTLASGPRPSGDVVREAEEYGIRERTLRRAFKELGGKARKAEFDGGWLWELPGPPVMPARPEDGQPALPP